MFVDRTPSQEKALMFALFCYDQHGIIADDFQLCSLLSSGISLHCSTVIVREKPCPLTVIFCCTYLILSFVLNAVWYPSVVDNNFSFSIPRNPKSLRCLFQFCTPHLVLNLVLLMLLLSSAITDIDLHCRWPRVGKVWNTLKTTYVGWQALLSKTYVS